MKKLLSLALMLLAAQAMAAVTTVGGKVSAYSGDASFSSATVTNTLSVGSRLGIGTAVPETELHVVGVAVSSRSIIGRTSLPADLTTNITGTSPGLVVAINPSSFDPIAFLGFGSNSAASRLSLAKTRSTTGNDANTATQHNDGIGDLSAWGTDGSQFFRTGRIIFEQEGNAFTNAVPGRIKFETSANAVGAPITAMVIDSTQTVRIGVGANVSSVTARGFMIPVTYTLAQIRAMTPTAIEVGGLIICSNCASTFGVCQATGTTIQGFRLGLTGTTTCQ